MGYTNVKHFAWGFQGWLAEVDPGRGEGLLPKGPVEGEPFPALRLALLQPERDCSYLGLSPGTQVFSLPDIRAEFVLIVVLNEMCTLCMEELPQIDRLSGFAGKDAALGHRLKILGLAAGSTKRAVARMRKEKDLDLLLLADEKWQFFEELGRPELPTFYLLRNDPAAGLITFWRHTGGIGDPEFFSRRLLDLTRPRS
jgi:hypothetical protein